MKTRQGVHNPPFVGHNFSAPPGWSIGLENVEKTIGIPESL